MLLDIDISNPPETWFCWHDNIQYCEHPPTPQLRRDVNIAYNKRLHVDG